MDIKKLEDAVRLSDDAIVTVTDMGHLVEVQHMEKCNRGARIKKLDAESYCDLSTGEIKKFDRTNTRADSFNSLRQTFKKMRYAINYNFKGKPNELFVTLTYRGDLQTNDHLKVGNDYKTFMKRLKRKYGSVDAIRVLEPHASGNYHLHVLLRFNDYDSIYIPNKVIDGVSVDAPLRDIWGNGNVTIKGLSNVDNIGAYVSAYMTDMPVSDDYEGECLTKEIDGKSKKFIKGGRLIFYKPGVNIFTKTRGIVYPERVDMTYKKAKKIVGECAPHYQTSIQLSDLDNDFTNVITYEHYNKLR